MKRAGKIGGMLIAVMLMTSACQKENGISYMTVRMTDQPIDFDEVNVEIELIQVHSSGDGDSTTMDGWLNLSTNSGVYDLLDLQNGVTAALVTGQEIPAGHLTQMRLILGDDNTVMVDSVLFPLELTSQDRTGLKLNLDTFVDDGDSVDVVFDFDAEKSIVIQGNGTYKLKPVLHMESVIIF